MNIIPSEFRKLYVGKKGTHEKDIQREDNIVSNRYSRLMILSHPKLGDTYIDIVIWDKDKKVEIKVSDRNTDPSIEPLKNTIFFSEKFLNDPYLNVMRLQYLEEGVKKDHTLSSLGNIIGQNIEAYFNEKRIKLLILKSPNNKAFLYAQHQYYSDSEIIEIYLVSVFIPFLKKITKQSVDKFVLSNSIQSQTTSSSQSLKNKFFTFIIVAILFTGCLTMVTRKRIGAECNDGSKSYSTGSGTCSQHGGVNSWTYEYWWDK